MKRISKTVKVGALVAALPLFLTSCATIVSGGDPSITINGTVKEPVTITTEKQTYPNVSLPAVVKVNRHHLDGQREQYLGCGNDREFHQCQRLDGWLRYLCHGR